MQDNILNTVDLYYIVIFLRSKLFQNVNPRGNLCKPRNNLIFCAKNVYIFAIPLCPPFEKKPSLIQHNNRV